MSPWIQLIVSIASGVVVAIVTSLVTVRLSLRQFYSQRWWERKADAYSVVVESLYHMKRQLEVLMDEAMTQREIPADKGKRLAELSAKADEEIRKAEGIGAFVISDAAADCLANLRRRLDEHLADMSWYDILDARWAAVNECLAEMRATAKADLKVR